MPASAYVYEQLKVEPIANGVYNVQLNRPEKRNALSMQLWRELADLYTRLDTDSDCRVVVLTGNGKVFSAGIDLKGFAQLITETSDVDGARTGRKMMRIAELLAKSFTLIEKCSKPTIAAIHGTCLGAAMDLVTAADIRLCTSDTEFAVKEVVIGIASDMGVLNRLPKMCSNASWMKEVSLTGRNFGAREALQFGIVSGVYENQEELLSAAKKVALRLAELSPVAVQGAKRILDYSRDHTVDDSLNFVSVWNASQCQTEDIAKSVQALLAKQRLPQYSKL